MGADKKKYFRLMKNRSSNIRLLCKTFFFLLASLTICTCIEPYDPELGSYESLLVVDGLITDANSSYEIKLSRTFQNENSQPERCFRCNRIHIR